MKVPQAGADKRVPSLEAVLDSINKAGPYRLVYMILLESGLRLVEAVKLVREYPSLECTRLDGFTRCLLGYTRGKKRALWGYHITPITSIEGLTDRRVTSYAEKYGLVPPKLVRKFVATKMAELGIPFEVIDFIQGRAPRTVLLQHYAQLLGLADKHYATYAAWLRQVFEERLRGGDRHACVAMLAALATAPAPLRCAHSHPAGRAGLGAGVPARVLLLHRAAGERRAGGGDRGPVLPCGAGEHGAPQAQGMQRYKWG